MEPLSSLCMFTGGSGQTMVMEKCSGRPSPCLSTGKQGTKKQTATEQGQVFCQHVTVLCPGTLQSQAGDVRGTVGRSHTRPLEDE
jgi:hypothetical protein